MKRGRVSPCEDGSQKTAPLLRRECCRREEEPWRLRGQNVNVIATWAAGIIHAMASAVPMKGNRDVNQASGVAWNYFPL